MKHIAIFASGSGSNAENIIRYFSTKKIANVSLVLSNKSKALVLKRAETLGITSFFFDQADFYYTGAVLAKLKSYNIDYIVLAGFLWLVPPEIIDEFRGRIINIHPALLPSYGGKGMYGDAVHKAVIANGEKESGITIHHVNYAFDEGDIIFQAKCNIEPGDSPESLAAKIHNLEYMHFPRVIEEELFRLS